MADEIQKDDKTDEIPFSWGKRRGKGGAKKETQFYESFTFDGVEYSLYDSVYLFKDGEPEPYIGKVLKIWETALKEKKMKKVKVLWFFRPSEVSHYLGGETVLPNELFLAAGEGVGLVNINPLEAIAGKCNVVCISKDERNRQPYDEELEKADYVFYRTFDVGNFTFSDKLGEKIATIEVSSLLNKKDSRLLVVSPSNKDIGTVAVVISETPLISAANTSGDDKVVEPEANVGSILVEYDDKGTKDSESGEKSGLKSADINQTDVDKVINCTANDRLPELKTSLLPNHGGSVNMSDHKAMNSGKKLPVESGAKSFKDSVQAIVARDKKLDLPKDSHELNGAVKKAKSVNSRGALEERPVKKFKRNEIATPSSDKSRNGTQKSAVAAVNNEASRASAETKGIKVVGTSNGLSKKLKSEGGDLPQVAEASGRDKLRKDFAGTSDGMSKKFDGIYKKLESKGAMEDKSDGKLCKASLERARNDEIEAYGCMKEVTRRPHKGKSNWFNRGLWEDRIKSGQERGTLVLLQNLDPTYTSTEVEDIVWHGFGENCTAKMIQRNVLSSPHSGEAFVIFNTREAAHKVLHKLEQECLMLPNGRPLVGGPWVKTCAGRLSSFPGHLAIEKLKAQQQREAKTVSTSHTSQPNTIEYDLAIEWRLLQERADLWWKLLHKQQEEGLKKLKASLKSNVPKKLKMIAYSK